VPRPSRGGKGQTVRVAIELAMFPRLHIGKKGEGNRGGTRERKKRRIVLAFHLNRVEKVGGGKEDEKLRFRYLLVRPGKEKRWWSRAKSFASCFSAMAGVKKKAPADICRCCFPARRRKEGTITPFFAMSGREKNSTFIPGERGKTNCMRQPALFHFLEKRGGKKKVKGTGKRPIRRIESSRARGEKKGKKADYPRHNHRKGER